MSLYDCIKKLDTFIPITLNVFSASSLQSPVAKEFEHIITTMRIDATNYSSDWSASSANKGLMDLRDKLKGITGVPTNYQGLFNDILEVDKLIALYTNEQPTPVQTIEALTEIKKSYSSFTCDI